METLTPRQAFDHFMQHTLDQLIQGNRKGNALYARAKQLQRALEGKVSDWNADDASIEAFLTKEAPEHYEFRHHVEVLVKKSE